MAPTLRSDRQLGDEETQHETSQVMSPTRARPRTEEASGALVNEDEDAASGGGQRASHQDDSTLTDAFARSLAENPVGAALRRALLDGLQDHSGNADQSPPPSEEEEEEDREDIRGPPLDNMNPSGRYVDEELAEATRALRNSPVIKLPKPQSKADYKAWKSEVPLHFETCTLGDITYGTERYDENEGLRRPKYAEWFRMRKNKAFSALALSLSVDLRSTFRVDELRDNMKAASALYNQIVQHLEAGDGINPDYLLQDLVTRKLRQGESVSAYVDDVGRKVTQLRQANGEFEEWQHASLLLSNCVLVFRELARERADWINNNNRKSLKLAEALQRLRSAEHQRAQLQQQSKPAVPRGMQVAQVTSSSNNSKKRSKHQRKRNKGITDKTMKTNCANRNGEGHWYAECTENTGIPLKAELAKKLKENQAKKNPTSLINRVRRVEMIPSADAQGLIASLCTESEPMNIEDIVGNRSTAVPSPTSRSASTALSASAGGDGQEAADLLMQMANVSSSPPHQQLQLPREALPAQGLQPSQEGQCEQGAVQRQWEGPLQGTPPTWENLLFQLGQGLKQSLQGATVTSAWTQPIASAWTRTQSVATTWTRPQSVTATRTLEQSIARASIPVVTTALAQKIATKELACWLSTPALA
ncbi:hypothetical protein PF005_g5816 [Phytophthora fragariae]|uniref:Uncharacterized protein n=2 Tax=Phytophthora fragariae TaxID=53985 RepID=A0A6A3YW86_9STRA|nr:hypothetical protein PF005_g5816 [Phytophthora fragariae]